MAYSKKHFMIVAGEASGDMHAAHLVEEILKRDPSIYFSGLGGPSMREKGVEVFYDLTKIAVVGFVEVLKHYGEFSRLMRRFLKKVRDEKPDAVILVDYPGFNLILAKKLKKMGTKVIYYISPQVWAWKENRVKAIKKHVDLMLVLFLFEEEFYQKRGIEAEFVGHPLMDSVQTRFSKDSFLKKIGLPDYKFTISLLPGSREKEVERHLSVMLDAARIIHKDFPMSQFLIIKAPSIEQSLIEAKANEHRELPVKIIEQYNYDAINASDFCIVTSGTATLEVAILLKPMIVIYKTSFLTWLLAKMFIKIPDIGLVNVVAGKRIVPECVQHQAKADVIARMVKEIFTDELRIADIKNELAVVKASLGHPGASRRAAEKIMQFIDQ